MTDQQQGPTSEAERPRVLAAILRMDLQGSESVTREDDRAFTAFMAALRKQVELYPSRLGKLQAEGDSIRQAFTDLRVALRCAFYLRTAAQQPIVTKVGLRSLPPRIVLHFGALIKNEDYAEGAAQINAHATRPRGASWPDPCNRSLC
jgi:hypothetical protein